MKIKHIIVFSLISVLAYQCSSKKSSSLLPLVQSKTSDNGSAGYYFSEYATEDDYVSKYQRIIPLVNYFDDTKKPVDGTKTNCKTPDLTGGEKSTLPLNETTTINLYKTFRDDVPKTPFNLQATIDKVIKDAVPLSKDVSDVLKQSDSFPSSGGYIRQKRKDGDKDKVECRLLARGGGEPKQFVEKGLFAYPYYNAMLILKDIKGKTNTDAKTTYTDREKEWDKLFSYFGVPTDYSFARYEKGAEAKGLSLQGKYAIEKIKKKGKWKVTSPALRTIADDIMQKGFIAGRNAITNNDNAALDAAIKVVAQKWEQIIVASVLYYIEGAYEGLNAGTESNRVKFAHTLSEGWAIAYAFYFIAELDSTFKTTVDIKGKTLTKEAVNKIFTDLNNAKAVTSKDALDVATPQFNTGTAAEYKTKLGDARTKIVAVFTEFKNEYKLD